MANTQRTLSQVLALLADNATGDISAQDMRDAVLSLASDHAGMYISTSAATTISTVDVWVDEGSTWTLSPDSHNFSEDTDGRLQYDGAASRHVHVTASASVTSSGNGKTYEIGIAKNGTVYTPSISQRKIVIGTEVGDVSVTAMIPMDTGDYLTLQVRNVTDDTNATITKANIVAMGMIE